MFPIVSRPQSLGLTGDDGRLSHAVETPREVATSLGTCPTSDLAHWTDEIRTRALTVYTVTGYL